MRRITIFVLTALSLLTLAGCETVGGMGRDISKGAEALDRAF